MGWADSAKTGIILQRMRKQARLTQADAAKLVGLSRPQISNLESGKFSFTVENINKFCDLFGCTPNELLGWEKPKINQLQIEVYDLRAKLLKIGNILKDNP